MVTITNYFVSRQTGGAKSNSGGAVAPLADAT